jgi:signal transduction histidine kinase
VTQLAITFLIPALTLTFFWWALRRRSRLRESDLQVRLEAARQLSDAKDEFIAGLSHELRTPLTTIHGFSELLLEKEFDPETREMLTIINGGSADLSRMVADLLAAARIDADALGWQPEQIDVQRELRVAIAPYTRSDHQIELSVPPLRAYADPVHLRQIIHNLVSNAARHGGDRLAISGKLKGNYVALVFADDGPGVPSETEGLLFKRFVHRGRHAMVAGSVGLGLAVSRELAIRMGGSISYQRVDGWTAFTLLVPRNRQSDPGVDSAQPESLLTNA